MLLKKSDSQLQQGRKEEIWQKLLLKEVYQVPLKSGHGAKNIQSLMLSLKSLTLNWGESNFSWSPLWMENQGRWYLVLNCHHLSLGLIINKLLRCTMRKKYQLRVSVDKRSNLVIYCHILSYNVIYCHTLSYIVIYCHILSYIVRYYQILSDDAR